MFGEVIPIIDTIKANRKLKEINRTKKVDVIENIDNIDIKYLEEDYKNAIEAKNRFEDKAKTIIAALTIAITLILNLSKIIDTISTKYGQANIDILVFILAIAIIVYMLMAGIMSIQVLIKENILYPISLIDRTKQNKRNIYINTQLNINQNLIRNNIIFSAYQSIRNSVLCLVIIFILAVFPIQTSRDNTMVYENGGKYENISFGFDAVKWLSENNEHNVSFEKVIETYKQISEDGTSKNIYDRENDIIVTIKLNEDIYFIDNIISNIDEVE